MSSLINLADQIFGNLLVLERSPDYIQKNGRHRVMWKCQCQCKEKTIVVVSGDNLKSGHTTSCGCIKKEIASKIHKKYNKYDLSGNYGIGWMSNTNKEFYFDLEDYDKIKNMCWRESEDHYIISGVKKDTIVYLHRLVMKADKDDIVDHKKHNTYDNRKQFLRIGTQSNNMMNTVKRTDNTSDITGVWWSKEKAKWVAEIWVNNNKIYLGIFDNIEDAKSARVRAENKYFKDWSYTNSINS